MPGIPYREADALKVALDEGRMEDAVAILFELALRLRDEPPEVAQLPARRLTQEGAGAWASQPARVRRGESATVPPEACPVEDGGRLGLAERTGSAPSCPLHSPAS